MATGWLTVEFIGGPLDGALRPIQTGVDVLHLANGLVIHAYVMDEIHEGWFVRPVMRHFEVLNRSAWVT